jgi:hypothetical protein
MSFLFSVALLYYLCYVLPVLSLFSSFCHNLNLFFLFFLFIDTNSLRGSAYGSSSVYVRVFNGLAVPTSFTIKAVSLACGGDINGECYGKGTCDAVLGKCTCNAGYDTLPDCSAQTIVRFRIFVDMILYFKVFLPYDVCGS